MSPRLLLSLCSSLVIHQARSAPSLLSSATFTPAFSFSLRAMSSSADNIPPLKKYPVPVATTPLAIAARDGVMEPLAAASPAEVDTPDENQNTCLIWATEGGQTEAVKLLLGKGVNVNHRGYLGNQALHRAGRNGHAEIAKLLLSHPGIKPNDPNEKQQFAMHFAAFKKKPEVVKEMLAAGMDTTVKDRKGRTPAEDTSDESIRDMILKARAAAQS